MQLITGLLIAIIIAVAPWATASPLGDDLSYDASSVDSSQTWQPATAGVRDQPPASRCVTSGPRLQLLVVHDGPWDSRWEQRYRHKALAADLLLTESANLQGASRHLRWETSGPEDGCEVLVHRIDMPDEVAASYSRSKDWVAAQGWRTPGTRQVLLTDRDVVCGRAATPRDPHTDTGGFARIDRDCARGAIILHEVLHTLGAVAADVAGSDGAGHSSILGDVMHRDAYPDEALVACPSTRDAGSRIFAGRAGCDPHGYFNAAGDVDSAYNVADSPYLDTQPWDAGDLEHVTRIAGDSRYSTAAAAAVTAHPAGASTVLVARGDDPADAVAAGPLAAALGVPLLLTGADVVPDDTRQALEDLAARTVLVVGGPAAISDQVTATLADIAGEAVRVAGPTRHDTAAALSRHAEAAGADGPVVVADARQPMVALVAANVAARQGGLLVTTDGTVLPQATSSLLEDTSRQVWSVGANAQAALAAAGVESTTIGGAGPAALARNAASVGPVTGDVVVVAEDAIADALSAASTYTAPTLLLLADPVMGGPDVRGGLADVDAESVTLLGGPAVLSPVVAETLSFALRAPGDTGFAYR